MKEFEKWWKKDRLYVKGLPTPIIKNYDKQVKLCAGTWRAALEWVLEQEYNYDKPEVYDTIREELLTQQSNNQSHNSHD